MNALSIDEAALDVNETKRLPGYKHQRHAIDAGRATMGPESRNGFEFEVFKLDGRWHWRAFETVRPDTAAELKANGKPRMTKPADIKVHEEREAERAKAEGRLRGAPRKAKEVVSDPEAPVAAPSPENASAAPLSPAAAQLGRMGITDVAEWPSDGIPEFLKRPKRTEAETEASRAKMAKQTGPERVIKNPPDAKKSKAKGKDQPAGKSKTALVGELLTRKGGCTTVDIMALTGWPSVSIPQQAKACGLKLRKEKDGKVTRYFGSK